jgi:uncharacterized phage infection (PIP) family protein YhgE
MRTAWLAIAGMLALSGTIAAQDTPAREPDAKSPIEGMTRKEWQKAKAERSKRAPSPRDTITADFPTIARTAERKWEAVLATYKKVAEKAKTSDALQGQVAALEKLNAQFKEEWQGLAAGLERLTESLDKQAFELRIDMLDRLIDRMQIASDDLDIGALADEYETALEGVEDTIETLDNLADEWDGKVGNDDDDVDDWDDEKIS